MLRRNGIPRLCDLDRPTGQPVRYQRERPGELVRADIKKQARIPDGGGWRLHGRDAAPDCRHRGLGYSYLHAAVDDRTRSGDGSAPMAAAETVEAKADEVVESSRFKEGMTFELVGRVDGAKDKWVLRDEEGRVRIFSEVQL